MGTFMERTPTTAAAHSPLRRRGLRTRLMKTIPVFIPERLLVSRTTTLVHAETVAELLQQSAGTKHVVGDAVAEQNIVVAARLFMQEGIETGDAANFSFGQLQPGGELRDCLSGNVREPVLELNKILQQ